MLPFVEIAVDDRLVVARPDRGGLFVLQTEQAALWRSLREAYGDPLRALADCGDLAELAPVVAELESWRDAGLLGSPQQTDADAVPPEVEGPAPREPGSAASANESELTLRLGRRAVRLRWRDDPSLPAVAALLAPCVVPAGSPIDGDTVELRVTLQGDRAVGSSAPGPGGHPAFRRTAPRSYARGLLLESLIELGRPGVRDTALLHAACVARDGRAVILSGTNGVGKSTLTAMLVHAGWALLSDDLVPLEHGSHHARPVPFAMSVKSGSYAVVAALFPQIEQAPEFAVGERRVRYLDPGPEHYADPTSGVPVTALVFPSYAEAVAPTLRPVGTLEALGRLAAARARLPLTADALPPFIAWLDALPRFELVHSGGEAALDSIARIHAGA